MRLKFSVGVSAQRGDRSLLEQRRKAPRRVRGQAADRDRQERAPGWPPAPSADDERAAPEPPHWAW
jgi:hypothetical protein